MADKAHVGAVKAAIENLAYEEGYNFSSPFIMKMVICAMEASDAWLKETHDIILDDVIAAHWHDIEVRRRRAVWGGYTLPVGTTRYKRVCECYHCSNWTYETPQDIKKHEPLP